MFDRKWFAAATLVLAHLLTAAGSLRAQSCPEPVPPSDPTTAKDHNCVLAATYTWNDGSGVGNVTGRIYWPSDCGVPDPPGTHPLVLLMHGDGHQYTDYVYLMQHLAQNGFIAATISNGGTNENRSAQALTYLGFVRNHWVHKDHVQNNIALIGHSRGGEAVLTTAREIKELGLPHNVNAIISLAPTDSDEGGLGALEDLKGSHSEAYLVLYGTHDDDVIGYCLEGGLPSCGGQPSGPHGSGFSLFDRAGSEGSTEPLVLTDSVVTRSLLFIERANHNNWLNSCTNSIFGLLTCSTHKNIAKGYMNAFLRWRLRGQTIYRNFFTGKWMPPAVASDGVRIHTSYAEGAGRRVVDNFEQPGWGTNTLGGSVTTFGAIQVQKEGTTWDSEQASVHDTRSLVVTWSPPGFSPEIRWAIPNGQTFLGARFRDVRSFDFLSFRAGQVHGSPLNTEGEPKDFRVQLRDAWGNASNLIAVSAHAEIPYPLEAQVQKFQQYVIVTHTAMRTVRLPLCAFTGVDKENISQITFQLNVAGSTKGRMILDNLEFTD